MMNVVILAMCSTSAPPLGPALETWVLGIFGLYSSSNMLKTRCNDSNSNDVSISLPHNKDSSLPRQNNYGEFHLLKPNFTSVIFQILFDIFIKPSPSLNIILISSPSIMIGKSDTTHVEFVTKLSTVGVYEQWEM